MLERIDHIVAVVNDLEATATRYEHLGLVLTPETRHAETGAANRACFVGEARNYAYLELLTVVDAEKAGRSGRKHYIDAMERGGGAVAIVFGVSDVEAISGRLHMRGYDAPVEHIHAVDGRKVCDAAQVDTGDALPFKVTLIQYPESWQDRYERSLAAGRFGHSFQLKRLDHLAAVAPNIEAATRFWEDIFEVPVAGEIQAGPMVIRQLRIGDAILELLGPSSPESPFAERPAALASMAAWEVSGRLEDAVAFARERGFSASDPEPGVIPGTRRASIPAAELGGVGMQLLEYV